MLACIGDELQSYTVNSANNILMYFWSNSIRNILHICRVVFYQVNSARELAVAHNVSLCCSQSQTATCTNNIAIIQFIFG